MTWPQDWQTNVTFLLRWAHLLGGVAWIGLLYWFNLVNVQFQKEVDASIKGKMNPPLLTRTLWCVRWAAVLTWVTGVIYYAILLGTENISAKLGIVLVAWILAWLVLAGLYRLSVDAGTMKDGRVVAVIVVLVVLVASWLVIGSLRQGGSNRTMAIGIGGGL